MTTLRKTILIEANREDSIEVKDYGTDGSLSSKNKAEWTNILQGVNLKKGDLLQFDSACINSKGSNPQSIEFDGQNISEFRKYTDNFALLQFSHYINHNLEYTCGLPLTDRDGKSTSDFIDNNPINADNSTTNVFYGVVNPNLFTLNVNNEPFLFNGFFNNGDQQEGLSSPTMITTTNFFARISNNKYAVINRFYKGHYRPDMNPVFDWDASMSTSDFKLKMESGFQNPSNLAARLTAILHQTNTQNDFLHNQVVVGGVANTAFNNKQNQASVNGKALVNIACNGKYINDNQNIFYQSIATDDPMRFENGVNIILQADLIDLKDDINANLSSAFQSIENISTMPGATINAGTTQIIFTFDPASHGDIVDSIKVGMEIVFVSGTNIFDTTQKTIIQTVAPAAPGQLGLEFTPGTAIDLTATDAACVIKAQGPGEFITNTPIFLFANKNKTDENYDPYSPHTDPESFELDGRSFLNGIDPTLQPRAFGLFTFTKTNYKTLSAKDSIEYNYDIDITLNDGTIRGYRAIYPEIFLKWTGSNVNPSENYIACRDTEDRIYTIPFAFDDGLVPKSVNILDDNFFNYNPNAPTPDNEWVNESNGHNRTFTAQTLGTDYAYDYIISSSDDASINYGLNAQIGKTEIVRLYNAATNEYLGFGEFVGYDTINPRIIWSGNITIEAEQFFSNPNFNNYVAPTLPNWSFDPDNTAFDAADLGNGIITRDSGSLTFIRQTGITGLQVGTTYVFKLKREDALTNTMYIRTQNGVNNVNVLWDNATTTNLRVIDTNGAGNFSTEVSFEVLTAVDGIEIYFQANGQSISEVSLLQQGTGGSTISETIWNLGVVEDVSKQSVDYIFQLEAGGDPTEIDGSFADFRLGQILPTNMEYNEKNLKLIQKFCNNTEKYIGNETNSETIAEDNDNYEIIVDLGRTNDFQYDGFSENPVQDNKVLTSNLVNSIPLIHSWLPLKSLTDDVIVNPRKFTPTGSREQRLKCRSRYKGNATNRLNYKGTTGISDINLNNNNLNSDNLFFFNNPVNKDEIYDDSLSAKFNVGVYPIYYKQILNANNPNGTEDIDFKIHKVIAFELTEELTSPQAEVFKIMWGIPALFSPQFCDCNQVMIVNPEITLLPPFTAEPEIPKIDPATSAPFEFDIFKFTSFVNIGSQNPTCVYNETLQRFNLTELHTPVQLNSRDSSTSEGAVVIQFGNIPQGLNVPAGMFVSELDPDATFSNVLATNLIEGEFYVIIDVGANTPWNTMGAINGVVGELFQYQDPTKNTPPDPAIPADATGVAGQLQNPGRNDSQSGIFLKDIYFQVEAGEQDIVDANDSGAVLMTRENFYNSIMYKMGFDYYTLKPIRFSDNPFNNRYNPYYQNRYNDNGRIFTLSPITTNSDFDIANATSLNIFPQYRKQKGEPKFKLGYNNNEAVNLIVNSYSITADNLPSQLNHGFYRIYVDFPNSSMDYVGSGQKLGNCVAYSLRNYQSGSYFFSYASSYEIPITRDMPLNSIRISIRTSDGRVARNLNPKCVCFFKITREVPLLPTLQEQQQEIEELKEKNKKAFDEIMKQFNEQKEARDKAFMELQAKALAEGTSLIQVPIGDGYLGQQNTITIEEPQPINLLGIPNMLEPNQIIELQQNATPGVVEAVGNLPPPPLQFNFDPPPLQQPAIEQIMQIPSDAVVQGILPTEPTPLETDIDFDELSPQEVPMINLNPEVEPIEFGNVEITREQPDLFSRAARYTQQTQQLLTDEKNRLKLDLTKNIIENILRNYVSVNPTIEGLEKTLVQVSGDIGNRLELIFDKIDDAQNELDYRTIAGEVKELTRDFAYTASGDQIQLITRQFKKTTDFPQELVEDLGLLFFEKGGGYGTELKEGLGNIFTQTAINKIIDEYESKIIFNKKLMTKRLKETAKIREQTAGMEEKEREQFIRRGRKERTFLNQIEKADKLWRLETNELNTEVRDQLNRTDTPFTAPIQARTTQSESQYVSSSKKEEESPKAKEKQTPDK